IVATAPFIRGEGMLRSGERLSGTLIRGVLPETEAQVSTVGEHMRFGALGDLEPGSYRMLMGLELARSLGLSPGDKVDLMIPQASVTPAGILPRFRRFTLAGVFEVGMYEYDRGMVLVHLQDAAALYRMGDAVTGLRLRLADLFQAPSVSRQLMVNLDESYYISDWTRQHANFFRAIRTEKTVMFIILSLIVAVAAFNIVSTLVMVVTDKQADIAILRTQGASPGSILSIFMVQGALIGIIGTLLGVVGGVLLAVNVESIVPWIEGLVGQDLLSAEVYYINELKGEVHPEDVVFIGFVSLLLSFLSTLYPAWRAAKVQPAEALRYE
ncbi:MAG: lipoprotein-releasing ABC transporter permease subunit, partial [Salinisphaeraceae bacterium]|nr:lipoprotein-releasing ABC transporter permease subunit [Salinisphaeraceae bacterium]